MIIGNGAFVVRTVPTLIASSEQGSTNAPASVLLKNLSAVSVFLGGPAVTVASGYPFAATDPPIGIDLWGGNDLYAIVASGTALIAVLQLAQ
ncbi:MAG: hypothetical protein ACRD6B_03895 [Bryobacteraceae bacterium]